MRPKQKPIQPKASNVELMFRTHDAIEELNRAGQAQENDYFRKLDQELVAALREKSAEEIEQVVRAYTRMRCPKCGDLLQETLLHQVKIDACSGCGGIWLDQGEWEMLVGSKDNGWMQRLFEGLMGAKH